MKEEGQSVNVQVIAMQAGVGYGAGRAAMLNRTPPIMEINPRDNWERFVRDTDACQAACQ